MRGDDLQQAGMFSYLSPEQRVPQDHPLRAIRKLSDAVFAELSPQFDKLYARMERPSIAPEKLLRALALSASEESHWAATRLMTRRISCRTCALCKLRHTWPRTTPS